MICNRSTQPKFIKEQIVECQRCRHVSKKKVWCGLFGVFIIKQSNIIVPNKKMISPVKLPIRSFTHTELLKHFTTAIIRWSKKGFKVVSKEVYIQRRLLCSQCQPTKKCPHCGCNLWAKVALLTEQCPLGKWKE